MVQIRKMTAKDLDQVAEIEKETFSMPWSKESLMDFLKREDVVFLTAEENGEILGYCGYLKIMDEADILNVAVKEGHRGKHIGSDMIQKLLEEGNRQGIFRFTLEVRQSNLAAIHIYEKAGFVSAGIRKNFYEKPTENGIIMWKQ
ncbi:MAG: ribosomal protein S18-alanine N-acetyltransferase [Eubacteriales bacterium]|nr:ribosomal protein S18-alanine N-acetyltransferase [Eubacteriales bacterium]